VKQACIAFVPILMFGCRPDLEGACKDYIAAVNACNDEHATAKDREPTLLDDSLCEDDTSDASLGELNDTIDLFECKRDAYEGADCTTDDGFESAVADDDGCNPT
jgi:hypothetical protein